MSNSKTLCKVGGWVCWAISGRVYTFGQGCYLWGPILLEDVPSEWLCDCEGFAVAEPYVHEWELE